jgi:tryptophan-rich sensory protein
MYGPLFHILIPVLAAIIMNGIIYTFGINKYSEKTEKNKINPYIPPGYIVGSIWVIILGLLGYLHYLIYKKYEAITFTSLLIIFVILFCISYPLITGLKVKTGLLFNLITLILAFILALFVISESKIMFIYLIPLLVWASYVNIAFTIQCSEII